MVEASSIGRLIADEDINSVMEIIAKLMFDIYKCSTL